ncbi:glycine-rich RNA-binding protein RZ1A-like isoform X2 [Amaranthus tricolor]|uniref:glycine-rich RNA-binding protein RZ1A-like isoform X2 n=1 Tax=Amaranthus tricolor TaxID=29722 RepID=UPI00258C038C|nr:glycine-rich RNA-binding protein RZ1A-like isoform X2 [Amaranthus tricolor]
MTVDDENSIYVGGLPYECTEPQLRRAFELYGSIVSVKIINDRVVGGKCFGFVTFKNPRSAIEAINEMNGRKIGGRVVRVNEVTTRVAGARSNQVRESFQRNQRHWDKGRGRGRGRQRENDYDMERKHSRSHEDDREWERRRFYSRDRDHSRDRNLSRDHFQGKSQGQNRDFGEWEWEEGHDGERESRHTCSRDRDHSRDHFQGTDRGQRRDFGEWERVQGQAHSKNSDQDSERAGDLNATQDREFDGVRDPDIRMDKNDYQHTQRKNRSSSFEQQSKEFSSESSDCQFQVEEQLGSLIKRRDELRKETFEMEQSLEQKKQLTADLKKRSLKLEDLLASAKKLSSARQMQLTELYRSFQQVKEHGEKLRSSEEELQYLRV